MDFSAALSQMSDGDAIRTSESGTYVFKTNLKSTIKPYVEDALYHINDLVTYEGEVYICIIDCKTIIWDPEDWALTEIYRLTFRHLDDETGASIDISYDCVPKFVNGKVIYESKPCTKDIGISIDGMKPFKSQHWRIGRLEDVSRTEDSNGASDTLSSLSSLSS